MPTLTRRVLPALLGTLLLASSAPALAAAPPSDPPDDAPGKRYQEVNKLIDDMTLEEKIGQLFVTYAYGESADTTDPDAVAENQELYGVDNAEQLIDEYNLGGMIYFVWSNNVDNPKQIAGLSNGVQDAMLDQRTEIPGLVSTDQETGVITRVGPPATPLPGAMAHGASRDTDGAATAATINGEELAAMGVNQNFAPVADVNVNPANPVIGVRSFGEDPGLVSGMVAAQVDGYADSGIASAAKHFPGHGNTDVDSHTGLPEIDHTREEWEEIDLPPFNAAIDSGVDMIMTAHIVVESLDPSGVPATLSRPILTDILRDELGYDRVVVTDSLEMDAIGEEYGDDEAPVMALQAGADILLMPADLDLAYNSVLDAVEQGDLTEERIDESVYRILDLKHRLGLFDDPYVDEDAVDDTVGTPENQETAQEIADDTVTLVRNEDVLPLTADSDDDVLVTGWQDDATPATDTLAENMAEHGVDTKSLPTGANPSDTDIDEAVASAEESDVTVVVTHEAFQDDYAEQRALVRELVDTGKPVIATSVRDAYDIAHFPDVPAFVTTYGFADVSLDALARTLFGKVNPSGRLPVTIPQADDPDSTLYEYGHGLRY